MNVFITGATGFIGRKLALRLSHDGHTVHALYRSASKASGLNHENIILFKGDILDKDSISKAVANCEEVYHIAGFTQVWSKDPSMIYDLNITGTLNVLNASANAGVRRLVFVSTAGVFDPSNDGEIISEQSFKGEKVLLPYDDSKSIAEEILRSLSSEYPEVVIVNPTRVYGPGELSKSNSVTIMMKKYTKGKWRFIPGNGRSVGNYVYIDDVVDGLILSMKRGIPGEQYILGGENISYNDFFTILSEITGNDYLMIRLPLFVMYSFSASALFISRIFNTQPLITPSLVKKFNQSWILTSEKAKKDLGYGPRSLKEGFTQTIEWLKILESS